jgi:hypothetical protein
MSEPTLSSQLHRLQARAVLLAGRDCRGLGIYENDVLEAVNPDEIRAMAFWAGELEAEVEKWKTFAQNKDEIIREKSAYLNRILKSIGAQNEQ